MKKGKWFVFNQSRRVSSSWTARGRLGEDADERRFSVNELMERYICHRYRNWQWHHDKTVWPEWAKALDSNQLRALNS